MSPLTEDDQKQQDSNNPSQQEYLRNAEHNLGNHKSGVQAEQGNSVSDTQKNIANEEKSLNESVVGRVAIDTASTATAAVASPLAGKVVKYIGKIKTKKGGVGAIIIGLLIAGIVLIAGFLGPGLLIVQIKEALMEKFNDTVAAIDDRQTLIVQKKLQDATAGCTIKVKCRFKGMSQRQIDRIERTGIKVNPEDGTKNAFGRRPVTSLTMPDGTNVTAQNYREVMRNNPTARGHMLRAFSPQYMAYTSKAFDAFARKVGIDKRKKLSGTTQDQLRESMKNGIAGVDENGNRIGRTTITRDSEGRFVDENGNEVRNPDNTPLTQAQVDELNRANAEFDRLRSEIAATGQKAGFNIAKSSALVAASGGIGVVDGACTGYYLIQTVGYGSKVLAAQQLIRYAFIFHNTADTIKAGAATALAVEYLGDLITKKDSYGLSFTDSFGYKYAAHNSIALPIGSNDQETNLRRGSIFQFSLGGGLGGALVNFTQQLNSLTGGKPKEVCRTIKNGAAQVGLLLGGIALTVGSGGLSLGSGTAAAIAVTAALTAIVAIAVPTLQNIVAGELVNEETASADAGNAATAGTGAMNAGLSQAHALSPQTIDQAIAYREKTAETLALNDAAERSLADPFDVYDPSSPAHTIASTLSTYAAPKNIESFISTPLSTISAGMGSIFLPKVSAAENPRAEFEICTDEAYNEAGYAADPFCNIRYGLSDAELNLDPEAVVDYMLINQHIDDTGLPISGSFTDYIEECITRTLPLGGTDDAGRGDGVQCNQPGPDNQNNYFRIYYLDTVINDEFDDEDTLGLNALTATPSTTTPGTGTNGPTPVSGNAQALAQQIINSGRVNGGTSAMQQIRNYAEGNFSCHINEEILRLIATMAQRHTMSISSLNRFCTGTLTRSGTSSYHYRSGGGHAVDFNYIDGVHSTGANATDMVFLNEVIPMLKPGSGIGQSDCRQRAGNSLSLPSGIRQFPDGCNHIHIEVPVQ